MESDFERNLVQQLEAIKRSGLYRTLRQVDGPQHSRVRVQGKDFLNFSSNDYLGLANHPALREAAAQALADFGIGSGASRLICGSLKPHHELEDALATWKGAEAALAFSSGYSAALGLIPALLSRDDVVIIDRRIHASLVDGARLSGATLRVFAHNDVEDLEKILRWADKRQSAKPSRKLIVTESVFSMDGTVAPLGEIVNLKERFGAWVLIDEAHATGLYGPSRSGVIDEQGLRERVEIQMGTLGKALGASGGYFCGSRMLIELLVNRARSFIFSTAPLPAAAAAARAAIDLVRSSEGADACGRLWARTEQARAALQPHVAAGRSPILPVIIGGELKAMGVAARLQAAGFFVPAIRYPTVARGQARLRITCSASHTETDVNALCEAVRSALALTE